MLAKEDEFYQEIEAETLAYKADLMLRQGNRVAEAMRTEISYRKQEREQSQ